MILQGNNKILEYLQDKQANKHFSRIEERITDQKIFKKVWIVIFILHKLIRSLIALRSINPLVNK
jgi:hypothetical protein